MASKIKVDQIQTADGSGTIALQNQLSGMTHASVPTLTTGHMPAGSVIQVQSRTTTTGTTVTSTSLVDTDVYVDITPQFADSKILVIVNAQTRTYGWFRATLSRRDSSNTKLLDQLNATNGSHDYGVVNETEGRYPVSISVLDSPATTSARKYRIDIRKYSSSGICNFPEGGYSANIIAMEIAG